MQQQDESQNYDSDWKKRSMYHVESFIWNSSMSKLTCGDTHLAQWLLLEERDLNGKEQLGTLWGNENVLSWYAFVRTDENWRSDHFIVKIPLRQSGRHRSLPPHLLNSPPSPPPSSHNGCLAAFEHAKPSLAKSLQSPPGTLPLGFSLSFRPQTVPSTERPFWAHIWRSSPGTLIYFSVYILCVALTIFCYFVVYCLLLLPESKLCKSKDPSVTVSPDLNQRLAHSVTNLLNEWEKLTTSRSPFYSYEIWGS